MVYALVHTNLSEQYRTNVFSFIDFLVGNDSLCCFPKFHPSHNLPRFSINGKHFAMNFLFSRFRPPTLRYWNIKCHSQLSSLLSAWKFVCVIVATFHSTSYKFIYSCACAPWIYLQIWFYLLQKHYITCQLKFHSQLLVWNFIEEYTFSI